MPMQSGHAMYKLIALAICFLISSCASVQSPRYFFDEVQVVNLAGSDIRDINLRVLGSSKTLNCDKVANYVMCHDRFGRIRYPYQGLELSWTHVDGSRKSDMPNPRVPAYYTSAFPLRIIMEIAQDGSVKAFYRQREPEGGRLFSM